MLNEQNKSHMDKIGRKGISDLWILGRPYILGLCEPIGQINSRDFSRDEFFLEQFKKPFLQLNF